MLNLTLGDTETILFTGGELKTFTNPFYLFIFTNRITGDVVKVMATNTSTTGRYDKFVLDVSDSFDGKDTGLWDYEVRQKDDDEDMTVTGVVVEVGYMYLRPAISFTPTEYTGQSNTFVTHE